MSSCFRFLATLLCTTVFLSPVAQAAENVWLAVGHGGQWMSSDDGKAWTQVQSWSKPGHNQDDLNVAANFKGAFYAGGGYFSGRLTATRDGKNWSDGVIPGSSPIFGLEVAEDSLFAMDLRGKVFKTTDGEKWELVATPKMPPPTDVMWAAAKKQAKDRGRDEKSVTESQAQGYWIRGTAQGNGLILGSATTGRWWPLIQRPTKPWSQRWPAKTRKIPARNGSLSATACPSSSVRRDS